jgi:hypothetical protein
MSYQIGARGHRIKKLTSSCVNQDRVQILDSARSESIISCSSSCGIRYSGAAVARGGGQRGEVAHGMQSGATH